MSYLSTLSLFERSVAATEGMKTDSKFPMEFSHLYRRFRQVTKYVATHEPKMLEQIGGLGHTSYDRVQDILARGIDHGTSSIQDRHELYEIFYRLVRRWCEAGDSLQHHLAA